jgi:hypothetical protein
MKDFIKRLLVIIIFWILAWYLIYSLIVWKSIVQSQYSNMNLLFYIILIAICMYIAIFYWIYPIHIKFSRSTLFVLWLSAIIMWKTVFLDDPMNNIYFWDISSVLWVVILIIWPTNLITTSKVKKIKEDKNIEIIEV